MPFLYQLLVVKAEMSTGTLTADVLRAVQMSLVRAVGARPAMAVGNVAEGPPVEVGGQGTGAGGPALRRHDVVLGAIRGFYLCCA